MASRLETLRGSTNPILTKMSVGYRHASHIWKSVAPQVVSNTESGTYFTLGKEGFYLYDTERALRANPKGGDFVVTSTTYKCEEHAWWTPLDYKEIDQARKYGADAVLQLEKRAINYCANVLDVKLEKAVADYIFGASYYASGNKTTLTGDDQWSSANSDILGQLQTGKADARADMGILPNTLVLGYNSYVEMGMHAQIQAKLSDNINKQAIATIDQLKAITGFKNIFVGEAVYSTDAGVFTDIWGDYAAMIYLPQPGEMVEGTTPHTVVIEERGYPEVKTYPDKKVKFYEKTIKYVIKNLSTSYGYLISDCVA